MDCYVEVLSYKEKPSEEVHHLPVSAKATVEDLHNRHVITLDQFFQPLLSLPMHNSSTGRSYFRAICHDVFLHSNAIVSIEFSTTLAT